MTMPIGDRQDPDNYRVYLLRLWRERQGPWHASLQSVDATAPHRFADVEALIAFLTELVPVAAQRPAAPGEAEAEGS